MADQVSCDLMICTLSLSPFNFGCIFTIQVYHIDTLNFFHTSSYFSSGQTINTELEYCHSYGQLIFHAFLRARSMEEYMLTLSDGCFCRVGSPNRGSTVLYQKSSACSAAAVASMSFMECSMSFCTSLCTELRMKNSLKNALLISCTAV